MATPTASRSDRFWGGFMGLPRDDRRYLVYLIVVALFGWALAAYDFNPLVFALPTVSQDLHLSSTQTGLLVFTGLTYFATTYWSFVALRAIASGLANRNWPSHIRPGQELEAIVT